MGIGNSMGAYYDDEHHLAAAQWDNKYDNNVIDPEKFMSDKVINNSPSNITDDQGNIVDWALGLPQPKMNPMNNPIPDNQPLLEQQSMKNQMPFPDNRNPDTDFDSRFPKDMKSGILNDLKPQNPDKPLIRKL